MTVLRLAIPPPLADMVIGYRCDTPLLVCHNTNSRTDFGSIGAGQRTIPKAPIVARRQRLTWVAIFALPLFGLALGITMAALIASEMTYLDAAFGAANLLASAIVSIGFAMPAFRFPQIRDSVN